MQMQHTNILYPIAPVPAPRQTRADAWKSRPCVARYRAFKDEVRLRNVFIPVPCEITFYMPMPKSWSAAKRHNHEGQPHLIKPDLDNLMKALFDAVFEDDAHIWDAHPRKIWSSKPGIRIAGVLDG